MRGRDGPSSGSVVFVVRFLMSGRLAGADDPDDIVLDLGVHHIEKALAARISDQDEAILVQGIRIVRRQLVVKCRRGFRERHAMLLQV